MKSLKLTALLESLEKSGPDPYASRAANLIGKAGKKARTKYKGESPQSRKARIKDYGKMARGVKAKVDADRDAAYERRYGMDENARPLLINELFPLAAAAPFRTIARGAGRAAMTGLKRLGRAGYDAMKGGVKRTLEKGIGGKLLVKGISAGKQAVKSAAKEKIKQGVADYRKANKAKRDDAAKKQISFGGASEGPGLRAKEAAARQKFDAEREAKRQVQVKAMKKDANLGM